MSERDSFLCDQCSDEWPMSYLSEDEWVCQGCWDVEHGTRDGDAYESDEDGFSEDDDDFEDPFGDEGY